MKVLVVEDDADVATMYADLLTSEGYEVAVMGTGEQTLAMVDGYRPDIILLDIMLPGKDGIEVARQLAQQSHLRKIPIVLITALDNFSLDADLQEATGIRHLLYKPCRPKTLLEGIRSAMRLHD